MLLIGSAALHGQIDWRDPKDLDYIADEPEISKMKDVFGDRLVHQQDSRWGTTLFVEGSAPIEIEISKDLNLSEQLYDLVLYHGLHTKVQNLDIGLVAPVIPEVVYTMKMSHRFLKDSPHFLKCMKDIHALRAAGHGTIPEPLQQWYKDRMKATYDYKHPSLKRNKSDFFSGDGVNYIYDHDSIHESVKIDVLGKPAYETIKDDAAEVFCSKEKFFAAPVELQLRTVLEEAYVLALERSQIPNNFEPNRRASFLKALEKICTSIASGWWREFAWENYDAIIRLYDYAYVDWFQYDLEQGNIKPYNAV